MPLASSPATFGTLGGSPGDNAALTNLLATLMPAAGGAFTGLTGAGFRDTSAAFDVTWTHTSSTALTEAQSITWDVKNASHQLKFTAASIVTFPAGTNTLAVLGSNTFTAVQNVTSASFRVLTGGSDGFLCMTLGGGGPLWRADGSNGIQMCKNHFVAWNNDFVAGNAGMILSLQTGLTNTLCFGSWVGSATPASARISGVFGAGTNITGGTLNFGTQGTGTGTGGIINFQSHAAGASGSTLGTLVTVASVLSTGLKIASAMTLQLGNTAATEGLVCDKSIQFLDETGTAYKVPCVAA